MDKPMVYRRTQHRESEQQHPPMPTAERWSPLGDGLDEEQDQRATARSRELRVVLAVASGSAVLVLLSAVIVVLANRPGSPPEPAPPKTVANHKADTVAGAGRNMDQSPDRSLGTVAKLAAGPAATKMARDAEPNPSSKPSTEAKVAVKSPTKTPPGSVSGEPPMFAVDENAQLRELLAQQNRLLADLNRRLADLETKTGTPTVTNKGGGVKTSVSGPDEPRIKSDTKTVVDPANRPDWKTVPAAIAGNSSAERLLVALGHPLEGVRDIGAAHRAYQELTLAEASGRPPPTDILVPMARTADLLGRPSEALAWAQQALSRLPAERLVERAAAARIALATAFRAGQYEIAAQTAATVLTESPQSLEVHRLRVRSLLALGRLEDAEQAAGQASQPDGAGPLAETERAWVLLTRADKAAAIGDHESVGPLQNEAHATLERVASLAEAATDREWPLAMGVVMLRLGRAGDAVAPLRVATARRPSGPTAPYLLGVALLAAGTPDRLAEADAALARAAELSMRMPNDDTELGLPVPVPDWRLGDPRRQVGQCWAVRGQIADRLGKPEDALERFRRAYMISGDCLLAYLGAAETLLRLERPDLAAEMADEAIQMAPQSGRGYILRAAAAAEQARRAGQPLDRAAVLRWLRRAQETDPLGTRQMVPRVPGLQPLLADKAVSELLGASG